VDKAKRRELEIRWQQYQNDRRKSAFEAAIVRVLQNWTGLLWVLQESGFSWEFVLPSQRSAYVDWITDRFEFFHSNPIWSEARDVESKELTAADLKQWLGRIQETKGLGDPTVTVVWDEDQTPVVKVRLSVFVTLAQAFANKHTYPMGRPYSFFAFDPHGDWCIAYRCMYDDVTFGRAIRAGPGS
jgi:hypothetical protein